MDQIKFRIDTKKEENLEYPIVTILINEVDLIEKLKVFEKSFAEEEGSDTLAGAYEGLPVSILYNYLISYKERERISVLGCTCGFEGCWPMKVKITETNEKMIWSDFEQPHRNKESHHYWDYTSFGKFEFEKKEYQEQLFYLKSFF